MRWERPRLSVLTQYLLSYLLAVLLPITMLSILFYRNFYGESVRRAEESQRYALLQFAASVDTRLSAQRNIGVSIGSDPLLTPYVLRSRGYERVEAMGQLLRYRISMGNTDFLAVYLYNDDTLYLDSGEISLENLLGTAYRASESWTAADVAHLLSYCGELSVSPPGFELEHRANGLRYILLMQPLGVHGASHGTLVTFLSREELTRNLEALHREMAGVSAVFSAGGELLFSGGRGLDATDRELEEMYAALGDASGGITAASGEVTAVRVPSGQIGWEFVSFLPMEQFRMGWWSIRNNAMSVPLLILALLGLLLGIGLSLFAYRPIKRLDKLFDGVHREEKNELRRIRSGISDAMESNRQLREQLEQGRPHLTRMMLYDLLTGSVAEEDEAFERLLQIAQMHLNGPFVVLALDGVRGGELDDIQSLIGDLYLQTAYVATMPHSKTGAVLLDLGGREDRARDLPEQIYQSVQDTLGYELTVGVSNTYESLSKLNNAFTEAVSACGYSEPGQSGSIRRFRQISNIRVGKRVNYPTQAQLRLVTALRNGNQAPALEAVEEIGAHIERARAKGEGAVAQHIRADIVNTCVRFFHEEGLDETGQWTGALIQAGSAAEAMKELAAVCGQVCAIMADRRKNGRKQVYEAIRGDIQAGYADPNMSLSLLADKYNMTSPQISRFFKEQAGVTFIDFVTQLRITEACRLLEETDLRINEIMRRVGYADQSSFTRKFIQRVGVSPGQYRMK